MTWPALAQLAVFLAALVAITRPFGAYMAKVFQGEHTWLSRVLAPLEGTIYRISGIDPAVEQTATAYAGAMLLFGLVNFLLFYALLRLEGSLPWNPSGFGTAAAPAGSVPMTRDLAFNVLNRYLLEDRGLWKGSGHRVPRFLQNDFARYWRTMAVDFAYKLRKRAGRGWAIRNVKLRMSRKLIYVSGLLACYRCHLDYSPQDRDVIFADPDRRKEVVEHMEAVFRGTPLDIVAGVLLGYPHLDEAAKKIFDSYNGFLGILSDDQSRGHLESLTEAYADRDETYQRARQLSHSFRDGLLAVFFDPKSELDDMTKNYGVF
jgi:hypothetical protein